MNIQSVTPNQNIESLNNKTVKPAANNYQGASFSQSISDVARQANLGIAQGATTNQARLSRQKEDFDELFSFCAAEEELLEESFEKIAKLFDSLRK
ncbi:hypothetical protein HZB07_03395 [Candidatus Saganbacteria bacterium]|nr:hypothetical protein [Candidatus Saganbacteria bacterium]